MEVFDPEHNHRNRPQGAVALGALVIAGGQAAELLAAGDQVLHAVAQSIERPIEGAAPSLVGLARDGDLDPAAAALVTDGPTAVALIASHALGPYPRPAPPGTPHRALGQQPGEHRRLVRLAGREHHRHRLAATLGAEMDLGGEAALAAAQRLGRRGPPFAPAACWCARMTVPATKCSSQSSAPAASAWRWTAARIRSQTPARVQRRKRVYTLGHGPYRSGKSRQGAPVASFHRMALIPNRSSLRGLPAFRGGTNRASRAHSASVNSCRRRILHLRSTRTVNTIIADQTHPLKTGPSSAWLPASQAGGDRAGCPLCVVAAQCRDPNTRERPVANLALALRSRSPVCTLSGTRLAGQLSGRGRRDYAAT